MKRYAEYYKLINTPTWRKIRRRRLAADKWLCQRCLSKGIVRAATQVHHVVPVESAHTIDDMRRLCYDFNNTTSLCERCHVEVHAEKRTNKVKVSDFRRKFFNDG